MAQTPVLVTGASGKQGGAVAKTLLEAKYPVRALSRSKEKLAHLEELGAEVCVGDFEDTESLTRALDGVERAFLVTSWFERGPSVEVEQGERFIACAKESSLDYLVYTSVGGATTNSGVPHFESKWRIEKALAESGIPHAVLRPVFFMENFGSPWFLPAIQEGKLAMPLSPDSPLQMVALEVIGAFGAAALTRRGEFEGCAIELASDELTMGEAMYTLTRACGKRIAYEEMPQEEVQDAYGHDFDLMFQWFRQHGFSADLEELKKWGIHLTTFEEHLKSAPWVQKLARLPL